MLSTGDMEAPVATGSVDKNSLSKVSFSSICYPGLSASYSEIPSLVVEVIKREAAIRYKKNSLCPWLVFIGGTGTGKSTLFNALCEKPISDVGLARPLTAGPVLYAPDHCSVSLRFPIEGISIVEQPWAESDRKLRKGAFRSLVLFTHGDNEGPPFVVVDTPDLDSVEEMHRSMAKDLFHLADTVVFVASQEKYADEVPSQFLAKIVEEKRPLFFVLNKAQDSLTKGDILGTLKTQGITLPRERIWLIPFHRTNQREDLSRHEVFRDFARRISRDFAGDLDSSKQAAISQRTVDLKNRIRLLVDRLNEEMEQSQQWLGHLSGLCSEASRVLLEEERKRYLTESRGYIEGEVKKLFSRYDVLAKPRRLIRSLLTTPLEILGVLKRSTHRGQKEALSKVRGRIAFSPVLRTIDGFNRQVLERLSPKDSAAPLFHAIRQPHNVMSEEEIRTRILKEQDKLDTWIEQRFDKLAQELPRGKKWGIYSTSILWGVLILSFEVIVGGGFTVLDAALDSVIAPFVTKGVVGLFASREIQKVARELAGRYEEGLLSVIIEQKRRYANSLEALLPQKDALEDLEAIVR